MFCDYQEGRYLFLPRYLKLNIIDPKISFIIDMENNGQIAFLDALVSKKNSSAVIDVDPKPTRYLDFSSHHD